MGLIDYIILTLIVAAFVAVVLRIKRKGACGDCSQAGSCGGSCASCVKPSVKTGSCPACQGVDEVAKKLGRGL